MNCPYPHNLICAVAGKEIPSDDLPQDFEQSVEYVLENLLDQRESFMLVLRYMRGMSNREIGLYYGLTTQRIRQIIDKSLRKLRTPAGTNIWSTDVPRMSRCPRGEKTARRWAICSLKYPVRALNSQEGSGSVSSSILKQLARIGIRT